MNEKYLNLYELCEYFKVSKSTIWLWRSKTDFPNPIKIGQSLRWRESDIENYLNAKHEEADLLKPVS